MKLATRYFLAFATVATMAFVALGAINAVGDYRRDLAHIGELQRAEARTVAGHISAHLEAIATQLRDIVELPWASGILGDEDLRRELQRLLKRNASLHEIRIVEPSGAERMFVSRLELDRLRSGIAWPLDAQYVREGARPVWYGPVYFREGSTPYVSIAVRDVRASGSMTLVAEIDLRYVTQLIASTSVGRDGRAYVVDDAGHLVAHPDLNLVHRKVDLARMPQVVHARNPESATDPRRLTMEAPSPQSGSDVLTSAAPMVAPAWLVFVEEPLDEVMAPVRGAIYSALSILAMLLVAGMAVSRWLAERLTRPIVALERGAARIAAGDLSVRVATGRGDEIQALGAEFNRMAESLARSYAELERRVEDRTQQLADANQKVQAQADEVASLNQQLHLRLQELALKKEEAERANAAKTRFLAAASHDLRQPMQAISLLVEVLRERITGKAVRQLADKVQASVQALESLFVTLLDISRLDAGAVRPDIQEFRMSSMLSLIEMNFLPQALAKGLRLDVVPCAAFVRSDPALLERVLSNLVSNAIRYTSRGRVVVGCRRRGGHLQILVIDTGVGIPGHLHAEIFHEFFQVSNPDRDRSKGLGLGLSIVKRTVEILDHRLIVRSSPERGSMFGVEVPLAQPVPDVLAAGPVRRRDRARFAGGFVLVVDDDPENRFAIEALWAEWGCRVLGAASAELALAKLEEHLRNPDLIVADFHLRGGEIGTHAVHQVRAALDEVIPAIVITGDVAIGAPQVAGHERIVLLHKPINAEKLWQAADRLLSLSWHSE